TPSAAVSYHTTTFDEGTGLLRAGVTLTNAGTYALSGPLLVGVRALSAPSVRLANPDGTLPGGLPYYDVSKLAFGGGSGTLAAGASVSGLDLVFANPEHVPFDYQLVVLGHVNTAPYFT